MKSKIKMQGDLTISKFSQRDCREVPEAQSTLKYQEVAQSTEVLIEVPQRTSKYLDEPQSTQNCLKCT